MTTMTEPTTRTLDVPGATLTYDVRPDGSPSTAPLFLIGSPMGAAGFGTLAGHFPDRTVVTYDPRGSERSTKADPTSPSTPDEHADDLHRLIAGARRGPVDLFASSGGAVNALALVAKHPEDVRTLVAHEPPLASILPDREDALAAVRAIHETYQRSGFGAGMAHFIAVVEPPGTVHRRLRRPAGAGSGDVRHADRGRRHAHRRDARPEHHHRHPLRARLRRAARGLDPDRHRRRRRSRTASWRTAARTPSPSGSARQPVIFPSHHGGFLGGEYGQRPASPTPSPPSCARSSRASRSASFDPSGAVPWGYLRRTAPPRSPRRVDAPGRRGSGRARTRTPRRRRSGRGRPRG